MDERESIRRGEAMAGLGLLALLSAGLVGTIVYRIMREAPRQAKADPTAIVANDEAAAVSNAADPTISADNAERSLAIAHEESSDAGAVSALPQVTPTAASDEPASAPAAIASEAPPWHPTTTSSSPAERPRFVAPASR